MDLTILVCLYKRTYNVPAEQALAKLAQVKLAALRALADLASKTKFSRDKIAEEVDCVPGVLDTLKQAEATHATLALAREKCQHASPETLPDRLRRGIGEQRVRLIHILLQEVRFS